MAFFDIFRKKEPAQEDAKIAPLFDEETELKKQSQKIKNDMLKQRQQWDLAQMRLEAEQKRLELAELIEEQKDERYMRKLERKARIEELEDQLLGDKKDDDDDDEEMSADQMFFKFLDRVAAKHQNQGAAAPANHDFMSQSLPAIEESPRGTISYDAIKQRWDSLPANYKAMAKAMTDDQLRAYLINEMPQADADTLSKAIQVVRTN